MELFDFPFTFAAFWFRMHDSDPKAREGKADLFCDILRTIVKIARVKNAVLDDCCMESILNDCLFLIVIETGGKKEAGVVINSG